MTALIYGRFVRSSVVGRLVPTTQSSSSCALVWTVGKRAMARKKDDKADTVYICQADPKCKLFFHSFHDGVLTVSAPAP